MTSSGRSGDFIEQYRAVTERVRRLETRKQKASGGLDIQFYDLREHVVRYPMYHMPTSTTAPDYYYGWDVVGGEYADSWTSNPGVAGLCRIGPMVFGFGTLAYFPPSYTPGDPNQWIPGVGPVADGPATTFWSTIPDDNRRAYLRESVDSIWSSYNWKQYLLTGLFGIDLIPSQFGPYPAGTHQKVGVNWQNSDEIANDLHLEIFISNNADTDINWVTSSAGAAYNLEADPGVTTYSLLPTVPMESERTTSPGDAVYYVNLETIQYLSYAPRWAGTSGDLPYVNAGADQESGLPYS